MHNETIERVLACEQLPTLPAVAARVIELTANPDVELKEIAAAIQHDQALAAKVLRTINSSYFGLRNACTSISQAIVLLGLSAVKSLALGFSLVDAMAAQRVDGFDYVAFWRRALYSAVGAKQIARELGAEWDDETFLGGLLQDIGVMALYQALGSAYADVVASTGGDHRHLAQRELAAFDAQHPEIGAMLGARWKLPDDLVLPIRYHERPTAAPGPLIAKVKCIALGNLAHDVLTDAEPVEALRRFEAHAEQWFDLDKIEAMRLIREIARSVEEVVDLFQVDTGEAPDIDAIMAAAEQQLVAVSRTSGLGGLLKGAGEDALTGACSRAAFDDGVDAALDHAQVSGGRLVLMLVCIDGFEQIKGRGPAAADDALAVVRDAVEACLPPGALLGRYSEETFGVLIEGIGRDHAEGISATMRRLARGDANTPMSLSVGIAAVESGQAGLFRAGNALEAAAMRALDAARVVGGDCERSFVARQAA